MGSTFAVPETLPSIRVLAADSSRMNSQLLANALVRDKRFSLLESEPSAAAILATTGLERPDVVLLSARLEENDSLGFNVARQLSAAHRQASIIMLLDAPERQPVVESFRSGARGIFCRTESLKSLAKCIRCVHEGQVWAGTCELSYLVDELSRAMSTRLVGANGVALSKREQEVVRSVADGLSNREIASRLSLTEHTVKNYLFRIFDKLGVSSRVEVVLYAYNMGPGAARQPVRTDNVVTLPPVMREPADGANGSSPDMGMA